jgi:hypothetical protein
LSILSIDKGKHIVYNDDNELKRGIKMKKYYALYDLQLGGFKAGMANTSYESVVELGAERAYTLSQNDEEHCPEGLSDVEILEQYEYDVREVSEKEYEIILNSEEYGLLTTVTMDC